MLQGKVCLVDMDNTIVDFDTRFNERMVEVLPPEAFATRNETQYWIEDSFEPKYHDAIHNMICETGFFANMKPIPGAIEAVKEMVGSGLDVRICTTPHHLSENCIDEKKEWVNKYLGEEFVDKMIFTFAKTEVAGDILFDDRSDLLKAGDKPSWTQILVDQKYNQNMNTPYRLKNWSEWRTLAEAILKDSE